MPPVTRTLRSLRTGGLAATARAVRRRLATATSRLRDRGFDRRGGCETRIVVETAAQHDVTSPNLARGIRYEPTRARPFRRLLGAADIPPHGTFVDVGCGKGRVLMLAALHGFERVTGIDYSPSLCALAQRNLTALRARRGLRLEATLHFMDAVDYDFQPADTVVFLFNPFDDVVLRRVLANLRTSLASHPRPVRLIYHNPVWQASVEESGLFASTEIHSFGGCRFAVYRVR